MSMSIEGQIATFIIPAATNIHLQRKLPTLLIGRICPHFLYDAGCRISQSSFTVNRTVLTVAGTHVKLSSTPDADGWAKFGIFTHTPTGQAMTITSQIGADIIIEASIYELHSGDSVAISAGCDHSIGVCDDKFANKVNFGGFAQLPTKNPFVPNGLGVVEQE